MNEDRLTIYDADEALIWPASPVSRTGGMIRKRRVERARVALQVSAAVLAEFRLPGDSDGDLVDGRQGQPVHGGEDRPKRIAGVSELFVLADGPLVVQLLLTRARELEVDELARGNRLAFGQLGFTGDDTTNPDRMGFVLTNLGEPELSRTFPLVVPSDVVALLVQDCGSFADRVRLLTELVGLYSDAVRLCRDVVRGRRELVRSLRLLHGLLRIATSHERHQQRKHRNHNADPLVPSHAGSVTNPTGRGGTP